MFLFTVVSQKTNVRRISYSIFLSSAVADVNDFCNRITQDLTFLVEQDAKLGNGAKRSSQQYQDKITAKVRWMSTAVLKNIF